MDKIWFIIKEKEHIGPYSAEDLDEFFFDNKIQLDTAVWKEGMDSPIAYRVISDHAPNEVEVIKTIEFEEEVDENEIFSFLQKELEQEGLNSSSVQNMPPPLPPELNTPFQIQTLEISRTKTNDDSIEQINHHDILDAELEKERQEAIRKFIEEEEDDNVQKELSLDDLTDNFLEEDVVGLEDGDDLSLDDLAEDDAEDDDFEKDGGKTSLLKKLLIIIPALFILLISSKIGFEVYKIYFYKFRKPVGMLQREYKRMTRMLAIKGVESSLTFSFSKDFSTIWAGVNFPYEGRVFLELESIPDKTLSSDAIKVNSIGIVENKLITFEKFNFEKGIRLYPGHYKLKIKLLNKKKLNYWLEKFVNLPATFDLETQFYIGNKSDIEFEKELTEFLIKRKSVDSVFWQDLFQRYDTLRLICVQIYDDFSQSLDRMKNSSDPKAEITNFEIKYKSKYGQFLTSFVLENEESFKKVRESISQTKPQLISYHNKLADLSKRTGEVSMDILLQLKPQNIEMIKNNYLNKLQQIEIESKNAIDVIKQHY